MKKLIFFISLFIISIVAIFSNSSIGYSFPVIFSYDDYYNDSGKLIKRIAGNYVEQWLYDADNNPVMFLNTVY